MANIKMTTRTIPKNYRNLTGKVASYKNDRSTAFESTLERDFYYLLEFDIHVLRFREQPCLISYSHNNKELSYTPDVLVNYRNDISHSGNYGRILYEIKYREDLFKDWELLKPKFKAARKVAKDNGWKFKIITEKEIRTPLLSNAKFLLEYKSLNSSHHYAPVLLNMLYELQETTPQGLLEATYKCQWEQAKALAILWQLILERRVGIDLHTPINMLSPIWTLNEVF